MTSNEKAFFGRALVCLLWIALGAVFILRGPRYISPVVAYAGGIVFILLAFLFIISTISRRRTKLHAEWTRKA